MPRRAGADPLGAAEISEQSDVRLGDTAYWSLNDDQLIPYDSKANINEGILLIKIK